MSEGLIAVRGLDEIKPKNLSLSRSPSALSALMSSTFIHFPNQIKGYSRKVLFSLSDNHFLLRAFFKRALSA
jgi:hypothetical protein